MGTLLKAWLCLLPFMRFSLPLNYYYLCPFLSTTSSILFCHHRIAKKPDFRYLLFFICKTLSNLINISFIIALNIEVKWPYSSSLMLKYSHKMSTWNHLDIIKYIGICVLAGTQPSDEVRLIMMKYTKNDENTKC